MYLKSIDLYGFKSFAKKTIFKFDQGVTGVVGPNGSGKSNIADAVRWVLGEQSAKNLRGASMQDVIFAGTENRKPLGYCQVDLTIDNHDNKMAISYSEVTVSRRVYRSGESEYYINQTPCRLKDIHELFMDTGVGKEGYSIIGQGQIEKILSTKPDDRRALFDEAVGIVKYKKRKVSAEKKLDEEKQNLLRINDIIKELEVQQEGLQEQAEIAKEYIGYKEKLKKYEVNIFIHELEKIEQDIVSIDEKEKILDNQIKGVLKEKSTINENHMSINGKIEALEEEIESKNKLATNLAIEKEKSESEAKILKEQIINYTRNNERIRLQNDELIKKAENSKEENKVHFEQLESLEKEYNDKSDELKIKEEELSNYISTISSEEVKIESLKGSMIDRLNEMGTVKSKILRYSTINENLEEREKSIKAREQLIQASTNAINEEVATKRKNIDELYEKQADAKAEHTSRLNKIKEIETKKNQLSVELNDKTSKLNTLQSKHHALNDLTSHYEGYNFSIKKIMELKKSNHRAKEGIQGVVADIIKVKKEYEVAIETALAGSIQNVVTDNENTAKELINYLKKNKFGRCTFLPLTSIKTSDNYNKLGSKDVGFLGYGSDLVNYDTKFSNVVNFLLGRVAIIDHIDNALVLARKYKYSIRMVTLSGEIVNRGGSLTGGEYKNKGNQFLARKRQIEQYEKSIEKLTGEIIVLKEQYNENEANYNALSSDIKDIIEKGQEISLEINNIAIMMKQQENELNKFKEEGAQMALESTQLVKQKNEILEKIAELESELETIESQNTSEENEVKTLSDNIQGKRDQKEQLAEALTRIKIDTSTINQKLENASQNSRRIKRELEEIKFQIEKNEREIQQNTKESEEKTAKINEIDDKINSFSENILGNDSHIKGLHDTKNKLSKEQEELYNQREKLNESINLLEKDLLRLQGTKEKQELKKDNHIEYMQNEYEIDLEGAIEYKDETLTVISDMKKVISNIRSKIKALGDVNVNAIEEFKTVSERYTFLSTQRDDLVLAEEKLKKVIQELKEKMEKQFREQFKEIGIKFNQVFRELFGGGKAVLTLTEVDNVLESGIDINAQPPGKKLQRMALLSGGEKAFTAISLLFAIQTLKPSPFCVLDEIEAALDDANVARFANYLQKLSHQTQFIIITHRRGTMEAADALYGITMQEKGVSTQVSVKLLEDELDD